MARTPVIDAHGHITAPVQATQFQTGLLQSRGSPMARLIPPKVSDDALENALTRHLERLREVGTDLQLISPRPYGMMHSLKPERVTRAWIGFVNDLIARQCKLHPETFRGVAGLPQYRNTSPINCLEELERCVRELGFVGCLLNPDPIEGDGEVTPGLGDEFWYPLYDKLVELDVPAMIHAAGYVSPREPYTLHFVNEETTAIYQLTSSRVFEDFPNLKIIVPHAGGAIPYQIGRMRVQWSHVPGGETFDDALHKIWLDTCIYTREGLELLTRVAKSDRVLFASELPGAGSGKDPETGRMLDDIKPLVDGFAYLTEEDRNNILFKNALELFPLDDYKLEER